MIKGRIAGPMVILLSIMASCAVVLLAQVVGADRGRVLPQSAQEQRANTLTCEATTQYDLGPASHPMRGRRMRIAIPMDATTLSVKYGVRELQDGFEWTDCDKPGADCYPPGNAWFSDFDRRRAPDGQEFSAMAWNGSRHSSRAFRILVVYGTSAGKCSSMTPSVVAQGTSESAEVSLRVGNCWGPGSKSRTMVLDCLGNRASGEWTVALSESFHSLLSRGRLRQEMHSTCIRLS